ncbi:arylsulfatase [Isoptericola sp. BMS4]|uniref:arylsulfatase n=1 Tax=Isoptericola sp. BMS4 TaxID=2527875 RepID=UPI00141E822A|nr:arylsulfatase [Isoptericola sp. BMS4]
MESAAPGRTNVVLVLADDLGFSDLHCYGGEISTPHIDSLAASGRRSSAFYNTARCSPSRASMLTGRHPHETGVAVLTDDQRPWGYPGTLSTSVPTIAEHLKGAGYSTALIGKWHLSAGTAAPDESWPTRRGFDEFYGILGGADDYFHPRGLWENETRCPVPGEGYYLTTEIGERAADFVAKASAQDEPFFLFAAFTAPHWPLHAPAETVERYREVYARGWDAARLERLGRLVDEGLVPYGAELGGDDQLQPWDSAPDRDWQIERMAVYAAQVELLDAAVGRILGALREAGAEDDTLILVLSDNGASAEELPPHDAPRFRERHPTTTVDGEPMLLGNEPEIVPGPPNSFASYGEDWATLSNTPFRRYKRWVHEGGIATPLIVSWPGGPVEAGSIGHEPGQLTDILPTVLEVAGVPGDPSLTGVSLVSGPAGGPRPLFWEHMGNAAVRLGQWKAVRDFDRPWELYNLTVDRGERYDLAAVFPGLADELAGRWDAWADEVGVIPWAQVAAARRAG